MPDATFDLKTCGAKRAGSLATISLQPVLIAGACWTYRRAAVPSQRHWRLPAPRRRPLLGPRRHSVSHRRRRRADGADLDPGRGVQRTEHASRHAYVLFRGLGSLSGELRLESHRRRRRDRCGTPHRVEFSAAGVVILAVPISGWPSTRSSWCSRRARSSGWP